MDQNDPCQVTKRREERVRCHLSVLCENLGKKKERKRKENDRKKNERKKRKEKKGERGRVNKKPRERDTTAKKEAATACSSPEPPCTAASRRRHHFHHGKLLYLIFCVVSDFDLKNSF